MLSNEGNEGWSGREGQPPRPVVTVRLLTPAEGAVLHWLQETVRYGYHRWDMRMAPGSCPMYRVFPHWGVIRRWFQWGNASGVTGRRMFGPRPVVGQTDWVVRDATSEMGGSLPSLFSPVSGARRAGRKMRPAGGYNRPPKKSNHGLVVTRSDVILEGETNVVEKLNGYLGDLAGMRRGQDAPLPGGDLASPSVSESSSRAERTN